MVRWEAVSVKADQRVKNQQMLPALLRSVDDLAAVVKMRLCVPSEENAIISMIKVVHNIHPIKYMGNNKVVLCTAHIHIHTHSIYAPFYLQIIFRKWVAAAHPVYRQRLVKYIKTLMLNGVTRLTTWPRLILALPSPLK
jgi:hypothetical protein